MQKWIIGKSDGSEVTKWAVGGMQFKMEHEHNKVFFSLFFLPSTPTSNLYLGIETKDEVRNNMYSTHMGHVRDQIIKSHSWEEGKA